jgi:phage shock protein E
MLFGFHEPEVPTVEPETLKKAIDSGESCIILDVRTSGEFSRGKIQNSINIPVESVRTVAKSKIPDMNNKIYVYCLSGARSTVAVEIMQKLGYKNVYHVAHGLLGWRAKYFPVM